MTTEIKRDLIADLAMCKSINTYWRTRNGRLISVPEAREGWAHAIRRALAAEAKWDSLKAQIYTDHDELQTCTLAMYELRRLIRLIERLEAEGVNANE